MERLKNFNFDDWRRRYMNWHKDNRARITDFFRRQDRDHDGKISREEFIQGILSSSNISNTFSISNSIYLHYISINTYNNPLTIERPITIKSKSK